MKDKEWFISYKGFEIHIKLSPTYASNPKSAIYNWTIMNGRKVIEYDSSYYEDTTKAELVKKIKNRVNEIINEIKELRVSIFNKMNEIKKHIKSKDMSNEYMFNDLNQELGSLLDNLSEYYRK